MVYFCVLFYPRSFHSFRHFLCAFIFHSFLRSSIEPWPSGLFFSSFKEKKCLFKLIHHKYALERSTIRPNGTRMIFRVSMPRVLVTCFPYTFRLVSVSASTSEFVCSFFLRCSNRFSLNNFHFQMEMIE